MTGPSTDDERREAGMRARREVLGSAHVDRAVAGTTPFTADFQDFITRTAWGDVWQRPGLARRDRSLLTLAMTIAHSTQRRIGHNAQPERDCSYKQGLYGRVDDDDP